MSTGCCGSGCCNTTSKTVSPGVTISVSSILSQAGLTKDRTYSHPTKQPDTNTGGQSANPIDVSADWTYLIFPISAGVAVIIILLVCCIVIKRSSGSEGVRVKVREYAQKMKEMVVGNS